MSRTIDFYIFVNNKKVNSFKQNKKPSNFLDWKVKQIIAYTQPVYNFSSSSTFSIFLCSAYSNISSNVEHFSNISIVC